MWDLNAIKITLNLFADLDLDSERIEKQRWILKNLVYINCVSYLRENHPCTSTNKFQ